MLCGVTAVVVLLSNAWSQTPTPCGDQTLKRNLLLFLIVFSSEVTHTDFGLFLVDRNSVGGGRVANLTQPHLFWISSSFIVCHAKTRRHSQEGWHERGPPALQWARRLELGSWGMPGLWPGNFPPDCTRSLKAAAVAQPPAVWVHVCVLYSIYVNRHKPFSFLAAWLLESRINLRPSFPNTYSRCNPNHYRDLICFCLEIS